MLESQPALTLALLAAGLYLCLKGLGDQTLRLDEARTALAVETARPYPWVPEHRRSLYDAGNLDKAGIPLLHTWGQFYLAWLFLNLARRLGLRWGASHPAGWLRLPFALAGWGAVWISAEFAQDVLGGQAGLLTLALGFSSTGVLLHSRQCRYYGPSMLFAALFVLAACRGHAGGGPGWWAAAGLALAGSYYFDWVAAYGLALAGAAVACAHLEAGLLGALALAVALALPWMLFLRRRLGQLASVAPVKNLRAAKLKLRDIVILGSHTFWTYLWKLQVYVAPVFTVAAAVAVTRAFGGPKAFGPLAAGPGGAGAAAAFGYGLAFLSLGLAGVCFTRSVTRTLFTRYVAAAFPFAVTLSGLGLELVWRASPLAGGFLLGLAALTNVPGVFWHTVLRLTSAMGLPARLFAFVRGPLVLFTAGLEASTFARRAARPAWTLPFFAVSIHRRYPTRTEAIARYLKDAGLAGPIVADSQEAPGVAFHSGLAVTPAGGPAAAARLESASAVVGGGLFAPDTRPEFATLVAKGRFRASLTIEDASDRYLDNAETPERYRPWWRPWPSGVAVYLAGDGREGE